MQSSFYLSLLFCHFLVSVADPDPGSGEKNYPEPGSGIFYADPDPDRGSRILSTLYLGFGMEKIRPGVRDKQHGSRNTDFSLPFPQLLNLLFNLNLVPTSALSTLKKLLEDFFSFYKEILEGIGCQVVL